MPPCQVLSNIKLYGVDNINQRHVILISRVKSKIHEFRLVVEFQHFNIIIRFTNPVISYRHQYALLPGISVTVLVSHFSSVIGNFRSSGRLDLHV